ncbi:NAD(P)H-binding protein [Paenibacillus athensensis]|uniref:NAD(P)-binding domain-containing protein n=1 Tax=Paenibacillus athensensis TaxID=1967502 RepID=A0A4Y8Q8U7_9BACL|nr:NAD(P)H-binding protein [Paenibacillus athensensis]MCD1260059.1 NAD(P)H-binding protein [Paenibacillus athensensis]
MHICLLGATGRVGRRLLAQALAEGHRVTALVRSPDKVGQLADERKLRLVQGNACTQPDLLTALQGADAVISCLGTDGGTVLTETTPLLLEAMQQLGVRRVIAIGTAGILDSSSHSGLLRYESPDSRRSSTRAAEEHRRAWEQLAAADPALAWTLVCPTYLPEGERTGRYRMVRDRLPEGGTSISTGDTADCALRQLADDSYLRCRVGLAY